MVVVVSFTKRWLFGEQVCVCNCMCVLMPTRIGNLIHFTQILDVYRLQPAKCVDV